MANNFVQEGKTLVYANPDGAVVASGSVVVVGDMVGVAAANIGSGKSGALNIEGVFRLPKDTSTVIAQGATVYWDVDLKEVVTVSDVGVKPLGKATSAGASGAKTVEIKINV